MIIPAAAEVVGLARAEAAGDAGRTGDLLDWVVASIFDVGASLQAAAEVAGPRITEALGRLDDVVSGIRHHVLAQSVPAQPRPASGPVQDADERQGEVAERAADLRQRVARAAQELQLTAADAAARLERQAPLLRQPRRTDHRTEIKKLRALADQARQIAERWEPRQ